jgi:hypothetical protein
MNTTVDSAYVVTGSVVVALLGMGPTILDRAEDLDRG